LKVMLQNKYNPSGITGGFGFMPFQTEGSTSNDWNFVDGSGTWGLNYHDTNNHGVGGFKAAINSASTGNKIWRYFNPGQTLGVYKRQGVTDWQYLGTGGFGAPNYDTIYCDSNASNGALAPSTSVSNSTGVYGAHWTKQTGLTATTAYTLQVASTATDKVWGSGVITYNGDYDSGVRLHNLSSVGSATNYWYDSGSAIGLAQNIDNFCTGANGGSRNAKLFLINSMLNDCGATSEVLTVAAYKTNLQGLITQAVAKTSLPCVGLVVNQPWSSATANAASLLRYENYRATCYQLAQENPDTVFVIDFWKDLTYTGYLEYAPHGTNLAGALKDRGWYNDGTHLLAAGNVARGQMMFGVLTQWV